MGRPRGSRNRPRKAPPATARSLRAECKRRFEHWFDEDWSYEHYGRALLGDDASTLDDELADEPPGSIGAHLLAYRASSMEAFERKRRQRLEAARARVVRVLDVLRGAALTAAKATRELRVDEDDAVEIGLDVLAAMVRAMPPELVAKVAPWKVRGMSRRARVAANAERVLGRSELEPRQLAVIGILAGVRVQIRRGDTVAAVLKREANAYARLRLLKR